MLQKYCFTNYKHTFLGMVFTSRTKTEDKKEKNGWKDRDEKLCASVI